MKAAVNNRFEMCDEPASVLAKSAREQVIRVQWRADVYV